MSDWQQEDEEEEEVEEEEGQVAAPVKDACLFLIDCNSTMFGNGSRCFFCSVSSVFLLKATVHSRLRS